MVNRAYRLSLLRALRARLALDSGMGADYLPGGDISDVLAEGVAKATKASVDIALQANLPARPNRLVPEKPTAPSFLRSDSPSDAKGERALPPPIPTRTVPGFVSLVPYAEPSPCEEKENTLAPLRAQAMSCRDCGLCERRTTVVWGEGSLDAKVMFIGEGPGRDEDLEGRPFVGRSGRLLTDIIEKGMATPRNEVYIANVVKCRPPGNRDPRPDEIIACGKYLKRQIEVIRPQVLVAVGGVAGCSLLGLPPKSPGLRGKWHEYAGIPTRIIFHPSYLLRQRRSPDDRTQADRDTWLDIQLVMRMLRE